MDFADEFGEVLFYDVGLSALGDIVVTGVKDNGLRPVLDDDAVDEEVNVINGRTSKAPVYNGEFGKITGGFP